MRNPINSFSPLVQQLFFYLCQNFEHLFIKLLRLLRSTYYLSLLPLYWLAIFIEQTLFMMCLSFTSTFFEQMFLITTSHTHVGMIELEHGFNKRNTWMWLHLLWCLWFYYSWYMFSRSLPILWPNKHVELHCLSYNATSSMAQFKMFTKILC